MGWGEHSSSIENGKCYDEIAYHNEVQLAHIALYTGEVQACSTHFPIGSFMDVHPESR